MKKLILILFTALSIAGCTSRTTVPANELPRIYPDYIGVTFPTGIAPLNFNLQGDYDRVFVRVSGSNGHLKAMGKYARFNIRKWHHFIEGHAGDTLTVTVLGLKGNTWTQFDDFLWFVSDYPLTDYGVTYRRFAPGYETFSDIGIYQRNIHNFKESTIISGRTVPGQCIGCHTANATSPEQFLFHIRGKHGATVMQMEGERKWLTTKTDSTISNAVYSYWHPSGDFVAHSTNHIHQQFWTGNTGHFIEVYDDASDVVVQNTRTDQLLLCDLLMTDDFETYPVFSADGKTLFYCSAPKVNVPAEADNVHYNLCSIGFDPERQSFGTVTDTLINAAGMKKSVCFPRPSYDGKWLLYTLSDFGNFPINHKEADLWLLDLENGNTFPLERANSDYDESFHNWSSDSHWILFASRRGDSLYSQIYICSIDENGKATKPFVLPQKNPWKYYHETLFTFNVPDFTSEKVRFKASRAFHEAYSDKRVQVGVKEKYHIYGSTDDPDLEWACVYLVPMTEKVIEPTKENLDSTFIVNGKFEFTGDRERLVDVRIEKKRRLHVQKLLLVTEPGEIHVTIGKESSAYGTPQNDSLQVWKDAAEQNNADIRMAEGKAQKDSLRAVFRSRSLQIAHGIGDDTTLGTFLIGRFE